MDALMGDVKCGLRSSWKDWRFSAMVVLTLAVCIGANTALFTIVNSVLLQPLPVPGADAIILMSNKYPKAGVGDSNLSSAGDYYDRLRALTAFEEQAMFKPIALTLNEHSAAERISGMSATPSLFRLLRVAPALGRVFTDSEGEIGAEQKVILSFALWQKLYAGDPTVLGRDIRLNSRPFQIVGVMPRDFLFYDPEVRYWVPLAFTPDLKEAHHNNNWYSIGRLKPGATLATAQSQIDALNAANLELMGPLKPILVNAGFHTEAAPLKDFLVKYIKGTLYLLWGGAAFVLLIGAVNIANLVLARASARRKEFATRLALGASHAQIARQLIVENVMVALLGGAAGLWLGIAIIQALGRVGLDRFPRAAEVRVSGAVIAFALAVSVLTGLFIALVPLAGIFHASLSTTLREGGRTGTSGKRSRGVRQALVVSQIGIAFVLLAGAGLLLASFRQLLNVDPGFKTEGVLTASTSAPRAKYSDDAGLRSLMNRSLAAIRTIPGVTSAGATTTIPWSGDTSDSVIFAEGYVTKPGESLVAPLRLIVTPGYMQAMHMPLLHGRYFEERDNETAPLASIVDERLANKFWPNRDPIGRRMYIPQSREELTRTDEHTHWIKVVGVVRNARIHDVAGGGNQAGAYYFRL